MLRHSTAVPKYCRHKPTGQAYIRVQGKFRYLGVFNSSESLRAYDEILEGLKADRYRELAQATANPVPPAILTIVELAADYLDYAGEYYRKNGKLTDHARFIQRVVELLTEHYGELPVVRFGPLKLQELQRKLIERHLSRSTINSTCGVVRRMFRWGLSQEKIPETTYRALAAVPGLKRGRSPAPDREPIRPVRDEDVDGTLPHVSPVVADMIRFQRLTACRPGEVCSLRPMDIERSDRVWHYRPASHKTQHHGRDRVVLIGPKAQAILLPYLLRDAAANCFSPAESERKRRAKLHSRRVTPLGLGNCPGKNRKRRPARAPRTAYTKDSYRRAIAKAIDKTNRLRTKEAAAIGAEPKLLEHWHPNQLRHTAATTIRRMFGLEAAQVILGHAKADVTQVYAERDLGGAAQVMERIG